MDLGEGVSGPKAKKSRKSLPGPPGPGVPKVQKKSQKRSEKSLKTHFQTFWRLFVPFSRLFSDFWDPGAGRLFRDFFETFWLLAPRLLLPGPRNPNPNLDDRQITHLICVRLKHLLYDILGGCLGASFLLFFLYKRPKAPPQKVI